MSGEVRLSNRQLVIDLNGKTAVAFRQPASLLGEGSMKFGMGVDPARSWGLVA